MHTSPFESDIGAVHLASLQDSLQIAKRLLPMGRSSICGGHSEKRLLSIAFAEACPLRQNLRVDATTNDSACQRIICGRFVTPEKREIEDFWHIGWKNWRSPFENMLQVHDRMPFLISKDRQRHGLAFAGRNEPCASPELLRPVPDNVFSSHRIIRRVGNVTNNSPELVEAES